MIYPYINLNGQTAEAVPYYASVFDIPHHHILTFGQAGNPGFAVPQGFESKAMFSLLEIDHTKVILCDHFPGISTKAGASVSLNIITSKENIDVWFPRLAKDGKVGLHLQKTSWSQYYGSVVDKFGLVWQFTVNEE